MQDFKYLKLCKYAGSKSKYLDIILPMVDIHKIFIEPFAGSGAVLLNVKNESKIANDINHYITDIFQGFKYSSYDEYCTFYKECPVPYIKLNKESYYSFRDFFNLNYYKLDYKEKAFYQITLIGACINSMPRWSKLGFNQGFGSRGYNIFSKYEFNSIKKSLENTEILNKNFFDLIYLDSDKTIWFLDPPYLSNPLGSYIEEFNKNLTLEFIENIKTFKGDVIYTDTLNEYNTELLTNSQWQYMKLDKMNSISKNRTTNKNTMAEYIFYNFDYIKPQSPSLYD